MLIVIEVGIAWIGNVSRADCISNHCVPSSGVRDIWHFVMIMIGSILWLFPGLSWLIRFDSDLIGWIFTKTWPVLFLALPTDGLDLVACSQVSRSFRLYWGIQWHTFDMPLPAS